MQKQNSGLQDHVVDLSYKNELRVVAILDGRTYKLSIKKRDETWYLYVSNLELISFPSLAQTIILNACKRPEVTQFMMKYSITISEIQKLPAIHDPHFFTHYSLLIDF